MLWILIPATTVVLARYLQYVIYGDEIMNKIPVASTSMHFFQFVSRTTSSKGPEFILDLCKRVGYIFRIPGTRWFYFGEVVLVADPKVARPMLENSKNQQKGKQAYEIFDHAAGGVSFFATSGPRANHVRKATATAFSPASILRMTTYVDKILEEWIKDRLEPLYVQTDQPIDIDQEMMIMTANVISHVGFEYPMASDERKMLVNKLKKVMEVNLKRRSNPVKRGNLLAFLFQDLREAKRETKELQEMAKDILQRCRTNKESNAQSLVHKIAYDPEYESDDERARDILVFFFAGFDTTAHSIAWTLLELARNPKEQSQLRSSLQKWTSTNNEADARHCPDLKNATKEALRLHPPAPIGGYRVLGEDLKIDSGKMVIPKGTMCGVSIYALMRNHNVFEAADSYRPSRWEDPSEEMLKAFIPFLLGRRNCIGQALANAELTGVVARLCTEYEFEVVNEGSSHFAITMAPSESKLRVKRVVVV